jgi:hypothetical protein
MKPLLLSIVFVMTFFGIFTLTSIPIFAQSTSGMTDMGGVRTMKSTKNMSQITRIAGHSERYYYDCCDFYNIKIGS